MVALVIYTFYFHFLKTPVDLYYRCCHDTFYKSSDPSSNSVQHCQERNLFGSVHLFKLGHIGIGSWQANRLSAF